MVSITYPTVGKSIKKPIIGLLGGIGSGKSTVAAEFAKLGCMVIDADKIAHELLDTESLQRQVINCFGKSVLESNGGINRANLGRIVFADSTKLHTLNEILHPHVLNKVEKIIKRCGLDSGIKAIVLDMPLLVEVGWASRCDTLIFVECRDMVKAKRLKTIKAMNIEQIKMRENSQISLDIKRRLADNIINNNSDFSALVRQITNIFSKIIKNG